MHRALVVVGLAWALARTARALGADGEFDQRRSAHFVLLQDVAID